jgi:NAD(P)-dependent dehydrogenase (short-subunit alcohol dehydrogenase family)
VTGVSAGIGVETSRSLAAHGAQVVGAARDLRKADSATEQVQKGARANGGNFELVDLDPAELKSVRACADQLLAKGEPFDVVIANAGVMATPFGRTVDGFEMQFGTNHLGHLVLVNRIASLIRAGGRLYSPSAAVHRNTSLLAPLDTDLGCLTSVSFHDTTNEITLRHGGLEAVSAFTPSCLEGCGSSATVPFWPSSCSATFASESAELAFGTSDAQAIAHSTTKKLLDDYSTNSRF